MYQLACADPWWKGGGAHFNVQICEECGGYAALEAAMVDHESVCPERHPKGYSPVRRWLREERRRENLEHLDFAIGQRLYDQIGDPMASRFIRTGGVPGFPPNTDVLRERFYEGRVRWHMGVDMGVPCSDQTVAIEVGARGEFTVRDIRAAVETLKDNDIGWDEWRRMLDEISPSAARVDEMAAGLNAYVRSLDPIELAPHQDVDTATDETVFYTGSPRRG